MASNNPKVKASKETLEKVQAMKKKVESTIQGRMKDVTQRRLRTLQMQHKLKQNEQMDDQKKNEMMNEYYKEEKKLLRDSRKKLGLKDFKLIKVIGKGAFGEVRIVRNKNDNVVYAMKTMRKKDMIAKNQVAHVKAERDLMANASETSSFLVKLHFSFQDEIYLYLVMEYCGGGDLMTILMREDILTENQTKFYIAELAVAINAVHELDFVHRDLKPDNILIANNGHIKLSDFGLAKSFNTENDQVISKYQTMKAELDKTTTDQPPKADSSGNKQPKKKYHRDRKLMYSTVGTPDYIAPEVFSQKGYDKMVDWWSMGVIMFECLVGYPPFYAEDPLQTCRKIVHYRKYFKIPYDARLTKECADLIHNLVCSYRRRYSFGQIKNHSYFKQIPWNNLTSMKPPFVPNLTSEVDTSNFETIDAEQDMTAIENQKKLGTGTKEKDNNFLYYTFKPADFSGVQNIMNQASSGSNSVVQNNAAYGQGKKPLPPKPKTRPKFCLYFYYFFFIFFYA